MWPATLSWSVGDLHTGAEENHKNMVHDFMTRLWFYTYLFGNMLYFFLKCVGKIVSSIVKPEIRYLILCF
jgi:hypothetical protein